MAQINSSPQCVGLCHCARQKIPLHLTPAMLPEVKYPQRNPRNTATPAACNLQRPALQRCSLHVRCYEHQMECSSAVKKQWLRGVTASTLDSESSDRGSNPREASFPVPPPIVRSIHQSPPFIHPPPCHRARGRGRGLVWQTRSSRGESFLRTKMKAWRASTVARTSNPRQHWARCEVDLLRCV